ncbi:hypothetical protein ACFYVL_40635 [Streptomyces sp. NPDC004111]|uniref:hypothetical protein n=1 Tax=Streptomyces sp. NPDC004111 TaxID=3364690 RepID=UPI0036C7640D
MDAAMDPMVIAAGTALVGAMATEAWQQARRATVALWRRVRPEQAEDVDTDLVRARTQVLAARRAQDADGEGVLVADWQLRLHRLLRENPSLVAELQRLLDEELTPPLPVGEQERIGSIVLKGHATGHGRIYQAGRDQHINER